MKIIYFITGLWLFCSCSNPGTAPEPYGPTPSVGQQAWQEMDLYAFVHFNMNTFTEREWGTGAEEPALFNPKDIDVRQWVETFKKAGMTGVIITAKHHDGFCLWPTATTEHSVKNSPWKEGKGDLLKELSEACREAGLKFGVYLSPWDRNDARYGTPEYIPAFRAQLTELLTQYGEVFEIWFDGANGGSGYYGGANETRSVDRQTYYDWQETFDLAHRLQPNAVIFSDAGPDIRWIGNESGYAGETNWSLLRRDEFWPGAPQYHQLIEGHEDGTHWLPAEVDVSIRPGWYYHPSQDSQVKSVTRLLDIYYQSVGSNASLLLNVPANKEGRIAAVDSIRLMQFAEALKQDFETDLAIGGKAKADVERGSKYSARMVNDNDNATYWGAPDSTTQGVITLEFPQATKLNRILLREPITLGQRVKQFSVEALSDTGWMKIAQGTTIGSKRILRTDNHTVSAIRIVIEDAKACPLISTLSVYCAPQVLSTPIITRDKKGFVSIKDNNDATAIYYTVDGSVPDSLSQLYSEPFGAGQGAIKAVGVDKTNGRLSAIANVSFGPAKTNWTTPNNPEAETTIDDDNSTVYALPATHLPTEICFYQDGTSAIRGFTYVPGQIDGVFNPITEYELYISPDNKSWGKPVAMGEFSNIQNSPILQTLSFAPKAGNYLKLRVKKVNDPKKPSGITELGIIQE